ncbi:MAG: glycosyltransferase [Cyanobacteria bacterium J06582_2]
MSCIVMTTMGSLGDLHPHLAIARELRQRGHEVVFATHQEYQAYIEGLGFAFQPMRPDADNGLGDTAEMARRAMDLTTGTEYVIRDWVCANLRETYDDLFDCAKDADLIITGELVLATRLVAEKLSLPWVLAILQPTSFMSPADPPVIPIFPFATKIRQLGSTFNWGIIQLLKLTTKSLMKPVHQLRRELGLPPITQHPLFAGKFSPDLNLALFSAVFAKPQADWAKNVLVTGFTFYDGDRQQLEPRLQQFLDAGEPPLVFTLGSAAVNVPGDFYAESIKAAKILNSRALLLIGGNPVPPGLTDDIIAVDYAPYSLIFPYAGAIVHQGGIGTTAQALRAGCPTLIVPYSHDQPDNAARVKRLGTSRTVSRRRYSAELVARELKELMKIDYQTKAKKIANQLQAEDGVNIACDAIERQLSSRSS